MVLIAIKQQLIYNVRINKLSPRADDRSDSAGADV